MDENDSKEINRIVTNALKAAKELDNAQTDKPPEKEEFKCPDCGGNVTANQVHCGYCGAELEWEE